MLALARLIRLPNALTTLADVTAGAALAARVGGVEVPWGATALQGLGAAALYGFGIALNDISDREKDARLHPERPLPSGAVSLGVAAAATTLLLVFALAVGAVLGPRQLVLSGALVAAILLYDLPSRDRGLLATLAMGACRALSMSLGVALAGGWGPDATATFVPAGPEVWAAPATYGALVALVTVVSTWEERRPPRAARDAVFLLLALGYLAPALAARGALSLLVALLGLALAAYVLRPGLRQAPTWGLVVKNAVFTFVLWGALVALASEAWIAAAVCALIYPLVPRLARFIGQRGS